MDRAVPASSPKAGAFRALRSRNFTILWLGNLLSNTGTWMQQVAEPWLVLRLSNSPFLLGLDSFMTDVPVWLLILAGGLMADRLDRRRTALVFQGIQFVCPVLIVVLLATGRIRVWMVIALSLVVGVTDALSGPSINALVPSSVPEEDVASVRGAQLCAIQPFACPRAPLCRHRHGHVRPHRVLRTQRLLVRTLPGCDLPAVHPVTTFPTSPYGDEEGTRPHVTP
jgi:hypothetical protein